MAAYKFALSTGDDARQAGIIQSATFEEALRLVGARLSVARGDVLEIGVNGFPPAHFQCTEALLDGVVFWEPAKLAA